MSKSMQKHKEAKKEKKWGELKELDNRSGEEKERRKVRAGLERQEEKN